MLFLIKVCCHRVMCSKDSEQQRECYVCKTHKDNGQPMTRILTIESGEKVGVKAKVGVKVKIGISLGTADGIEMIVDKIHIKTIQQHLTGQDLMGNQDHGLMNKTDNRPYQLEYHCHQSRLRRRGLCKDHQQLRMMTALLWRAI